MSIRSYFKGGVAALLISLIGASPANAFTLSIFHNNDGESDLLSDANGFGGVDQFTRILNEQRTGAEANGFKTLTLSAGDNFLAGLEFSAGQAAADVFSYDALALNEIGYDAVVLGNHDFDFGPNYLADFINEVPDVPFLSANLDFSGEDSLQALVDANRLAKSTVVEYDTGERVGVIGATTPNLPAISSPGNVGVDQDVVTAVQAEIDRLEAEGVDNIVFVSHLQGVAEDTDLISQLRGVDVAIAGGGDELLANAGDEVIPGDEGDIQGPYPLDGVADADGNTVPVVTTTGQYRYLGKLTVEFENGQATVIGTESGPIAVSGEGDPTVQELVTNPLTEALNDVEVLATSNTDLDTRRNSIRGFETGAGNLIADSFLWQAGQSEFVSQAEAAGFGFQENVIALQNGGGIRSDILLGGDSETIEITDQYVESTLPFPNQVSLIESIDGETLKNVLENAVARITLQDGEPVPEGEGTGRFAQVSGLSFEYDPTQTAIAIDIETGEITQTGERVVNVKLANGTYIVKDGEVLPDAPAISVITNSFTATGGDQYPWGDVNIFDSEFTYAQALENYLVADASVEGNGLQGLDGFVSAEQYPVNGEGRIQIVDADEDSAAVPEPATVLGLMAVAGLGAGTLRKRQSA